MVRLCRFLRRKVWHLPIAAYLAALLTVAFCAAAGRRDYPIRIRHMLWEYAGDDAVLAVCKRVLPDDLTSEEPTIHNTVLCVFLADKRGRIKCITEEQWDDLVRRDETLPDEILENFMDQGPWITVNDIPVEEQMDRAAEVAAMYDTVMHRDDIPYLDQRLRFDRHYMTRLINEIYTSTDYRGGINIHFNDDAADKSVVELYTGMVVAAYGKRRVPACHIVYDSGVLTHPDSPTTKYAVRKLTELEEIGDAEMRKRLCGQVRPTQE